MPAVGSPFDVCQRVLLPPALREAQKELDKVTKEKDAAINNQEYEEAARLREAEATSRESVAGTLGYQDTHHLGRDGKVGRVDAAHHKRLPDTRRCAPGKHGHGENNHKKQKQLSTHLTTS